MNETGYFKRFLLLLLVTTCCVVIFYTYKSDNYKQNFKTMRFNSYKRKKFPNSVLLNQTEIMQLQQDTTMSPVDKRIILDKNLQTAVEEASEKDILLKRRLDLQEELKAALTNASEKMNILVYQLPFRPDPYMLSPDREKCGNCDLLWDKKMANDPKTKAILFYFDQLHAGFPKRNPEQYWGFWTREGPPAAKILRGLNYEKYDNFFNFTMSFRRNSDIWDPYDTSTTVLAEIKKQENGRNQDDVIDELLRHKIKTAAWVVSNCGLLPGAKQRYKLAEELVAAGLDLDRRGHCFRRAPAINGKLTDFIKQYKFYMAFENSRHCRDYMTEKLTVNSLMSGAVPVVFGPSKQDVVDNMPPNSFIYAEDFKSAADLALYLRYLDENDSEYKKYLQWRKMDHWQMPSYLREANFCQLCRMLHGINVDDLFNTDYEKRYKDKPLFGRYPAPRVVPSIQQWYYGNENPECLH